MGIEQEIRQVHAHYMNACNRQDAEAVARLYTEGARMLPPNRNILQGRAAVSDFWREVFDGGIKKVELEAVELEAGTDIAYEVGQYTLWIEPAGVNGVMTVRGKYVVIWKKQRGQWYLDVDIWNSSEE